ncbi:MAG: PAS domain S-box protein [Bacteroidia bacterium]
MKITIKDDNISATKLPNSKEELDQAHEQFRLLVEYTPIAMVLVNQEGIITLINNKTEILFGYDRKELVGNKMEILLPERYRNAHVGQRISFFSEQEPRSMGHGSQLFALSKSGKEIQVEVGLNPIKTHKGDMVLASIIDVTERKTYETNLIKHNEELIFQNTEKEKRSTELIIAYKELKQAEVYQEEYIIGLKEMMFMTSHKLRVPITNILGISEVLDQSLHAPEKIKKLVDYIKKSAIILDDFTKELAVTLEELEQKSKDQLKP